MDAGSGPLYVAFLVWDAVVDGGIKAQDYTGGVIEELCKKNAACGCSTTGHWNPQDPQSPLYHKASVNTQYSNIRKST